jgi:hypothetical protein
MNFKYIGNVNVDELKKNILAQPSELWDEHTYRQTRSETHAKTKTLEVIWDKQSLVHGTKQNKIHQNYYLFEMEAFLNNLRPLYKSEYGYGEFIRVLIVKLFNNSIILPHVDQGSSLSNSKRTHIALITNNDITFTVNDEVKNLKEGEIWEIDNTKVHSVENPTDLDRIHLIIDWMPKKTNLI